MIPRQWLSGVALVAILAGCSPSPIVPTPIPTTLPIVDRATATIAPLPSLTATSIPIAPTETSTPPTPTLADPSSTPIPPSATLVAPTSTAIPPTATIVLHIIGVRTKTSGCQISGPLPDSGCTPGAIFDTATIAQICVSGYAKTVRNVTTAERDAVFAEYGIASHVTGQFEIDHLIPLELGGDNDIANLWPEPAAPIPGFHQKDQLENALHSRVCAGTVALVEAQWEIATNWLEVYNGGTVVPLPTTVSATPQGAPTPSPAPSSAPATSPAPTSASTSVPSTGLAFISVVGGPPGGKASATVQAAPGVSCSIAYQTPAGTNSRAQGLGPVVADTSGRASWSWVIGPSTKPGTATVTVTCDGLSMSSPITIG